MRKQPVAPSNRTSYGDFEGPGIRFVLRNGSLVQIILEFYFVNHTASVGMMW